MNFTNIKTLIFDCDGLLVDSEQLQFDARKEVAARFGLEVSDRDFLYFWFDGNGGTKAFCEHYGIDFEKFNSEKQSLYNEFIEKKLELCPGVQTFLDQVRGKYRLALCSNSRMEDLEKILAKFSLKSYFDIIISGFDLKHGKPDPECFLLAAHKAQVTPRECVVFENSHIGLEAAKAAEMQCVIIPDLYGRKFQFGAADLVVKRIDEVLVFLQ